MERAATAHLYAVGGLVDTKKYRQPDFTSGNFAVEATVVFPFSIVKRPFATLLHQL